MGNLCIKAIKPFDIHVSEGEILPPSVQQWLTYTGRLQQYVDDESIVLGVVG